LLKIDKKIAAKVQNNYKITVLLMFLKFFLKIIIIIDKKILSLRPETSFMLNYKKIQYEKNIFTNSDFTCCK
jgi:hypothetical protein